MAKKVLVSIVLLLLLNSLDILAESQINNDLNEIISASEEFEKGDKPLSSVRERRLADPVNGIFGFFTTLGNIKRIFNDVGIISTLLFSSIFFKTKRTDF